MTLIFKCQKWVLKRIFYYDYYAPFYSQTSCHLLDLVSCVPKVLIALLMNECYMSVALKVEPLNHQKGTQETMFGFLGQKQLILPIARVEKIGNSQIMG